MGILIATLAAVLGAAWITRAEGPGRSSAALTTGVALAAANVATIALAAGLLADPPGPTPHLLAAAALLAVEGRVAARTRRRRRQAGLPEAGLPGSVRSMRHWGPALTLLTVGLVVACTARAGLALAAPGTLAWCLAAGAGASGVAWTVRTLGSSPSGSLLAGLVTLAGMTALAGVAGTGLAVVGACLGALALVFNGDPVALAPILGRRRLRHAADRSPEPRHAGHDGTAPIVPPGEALAVAPIAAPRTDGRADDLEAILCRSGRIEARRIARRINNSEMFGTRRTAEPAARASSHRRFHRAASRVAPRRAVDPHDLVARRASIEPSAVLQLLLAGGCLLLATAIDRRALVVLPVAALLAATDRRPVTDPMDRSSGATAGDRAAVPRRVRTGPFGLTPAGARGGHAVTGLALVATPLLVAAVVAQAWPTSAPSRAWTGRRLAVELAAFGAGPTTTGDATSTSRTAGSRVGEGTDSTDPGPSAPADPAHDAGLVAAIPDGGIGGAVVEIGAVSHLVTLTSCVTSAERLTFQGSDGDGGMVTGSFGRHGGVGTLTLRDAGLVWTAGAGGGTALDQVSVGRQGASALATFAPRPRIDASVPGRPRLRSGALGPSTPVPRPQAGRFLVSCRAPTAG